MRALLAKDLRILRRSPLLVGLLLAYALGVGLAVALALRDTPEKPKVAFVNEVAEGDSEFSIGGETRDASEYAERFFEAVEPVEVDTREEAEELVRDGEVLAALVLPEDIVSKLRGTISLSGAERPTVEVLYNAEDPLKVEGVESRIESKLAEANKALSDELTKVAADYLQILLRGGDFTILGRTFEVLGLENTRRVLTAVAAGLPEGSSDREALERVARFAGLAVSNLDIAQPILRTVGSPIAVEQTIVSGAKTPLEDFFVAIAATVSLMFVALVLGSGMLALEREEHAFTRLVRGLVSRTGLLAEKVVLAGICATAATLLMTLVVALAYGVDLARAPLWVPALGLGALAFGAMGVAIGALARDMRAASLLAFLLALPIAFLALIPSGAVSGGLYDAIRIVSAAFPFKPALQAANAAINDGSPALPAPLAHLAGLVAAYVVLARVALRRFDA